MARSDSQIPQLNLTAKEITTQHQLNMLLGVASFMWSAVQGPPKVFFSQDGTTADAANDVGGARDGGCKSAAEAVFIKACDAIERIMDDRPRWDTGFQKQMEIDYAKAMQMNLEYVQAKRDEAKDMAAPHMKYNPRLAKLTDGTFIAVLGDLNDINNCIVGAGVSPRQALEAFDEAFNGNIAKSTAEWAKKATEKTNEQPKVDPAGNSETPEPPKRRRIYPRNRPAAGENPEGSGEGPVQK